MASASLRSTLRSAVAVGAFGALAVFGTAATAGAQPGPVQVDAPSFGSLGSLSGLVGNWTNLDGFFDGSVGETGSLTGSVGSVSGSAESDSQQGVAETLEAGSSTGSAGSLGQIAGNIDPDGLEDANTGSAGMSSDLLGMVGNVPAGSVGDLIQSGSTALGAFNPPAP